MPKGERSKEEEIISAINEVKDAMLENLRANDKEMEAKKNKEKTHYNLIKTKERLTGLERSI